LLEKSRLVYQVRVKYMVMITHMNLLLLAHYSVAKSREKLSHFLSVTCWHDQR
jgi:hypothetical protein